MTVRIEGLASATPGSLPLELRGRVLILARLVWAILVAQAIFLFVASIPAQYNRLSHPPADVRAQLAHAGLPAEVYAGYLTVLSVAFALVCCSVAAIIVRHRPNDRIGLLGSLYLALLGLAGAPNMQAVVTTYPALIVPANISSFLLGMFLIVFFFVFPDGQFVPRWIRVPVLIGLAGFILAFLLTGAPTRASTIEDPPDWQGLMMVGGAAAGIGAQIYRYARVSDLVQRQQTKWVVLGVSGAILTAIVFAFAGPLIPTIGRPDTGYDLTSDTTITFAYLFVPVTLGVAVLRYRLWDIDVVLNRALVYGALSASLVGLYVIVVNGLGLLVQSRGHLPISLLATALVAVLFAPLRDRLQSAVNRLMYGDRDDPYRALTRLGRRLQGPMEPDAVLDTVIETVAGALKAPYIAITLEDGDERRIVAAHGEPQAASLSFPLAYQGEHLGQLSLAARHGAPFTVSDEKLLEDLTPQIGAAVHSVRLTADLRSSRDRLVRAREEERRRFRRDLHDGVGPELASLMLKLETARNRLGHDPAADVLLGDLAKRTEEAIAGIRQAVYALRPPALDELGLLPALRELADQHDSLEVTVDAPESLPQLPAAVEVAAFRIAQEAMTNTVRHADACTFHLRVTLERDSLILQAEDDGRGIDPQRRAGVGLTSMRERAEELGGTLVIERAEDGGTTVVARLPMESRAPQNRVRDA